MVLKKTKGGGTKKVCLPKATADRLSSKEKSDLIKSKKSAGSQGKYRRSSKTS